MPIARPLVLSLLLALSLSAATAQGLAIQRWPTLQSATPQSVTVVFRTDANAATEIAYGNAPDRLDHTVRSGNRSTRHAIALDGLKPATAYWYQVRSDGNALSEPIPFRTPPAQGTDKMRFVVVGDVGTGNATGRKIVDAIVREKPDFVLFLGDNAYDSGTTAEFDNNFFKPFRALLQSVPAWPTPGNHEYVTNSGQPYVESFLTPANNPQRDQRYYSFDWGNAHFASIDAMCAMSYGPCDRNAQLKFVQNDLNASTAAWKFAFSHYPAYSSGQHGDTAAIQRNYVPAFDEAAVDLYFAGHDHHYERTFAMRGGKAAVQQPAKDGTLRSDGATLPGTLHMVTGGGSGVLRASWGKSQPAYVATRHNGFHIVVVDIDGGTLKAVAKTPEGAALDAFTLVKNVPQAPRPDPEPVDPGPSDPDPVDPGPGDPGPTDPGPTDPGDPEPGTDDPDPTAPGGADPDPTDPGADGSGGERPPVIVKPKGCASAAPLPLAALGLLAAAAGVRSRRRS